MVHYHKSFKPEFYLSPVARKLQSMAANVKEFNSAVFFVHPLVSENRLDQRDSQNYHKHQESLLYFYRQFPADLPFDCDKGFARRDIFIATDYANPSQRREANLINLVLVKDPLIFTSPSGTLEIKGECENNESSLIQPAGKYKKSALLELLFTLAAYSSFKIAGISNSFDFVGDSLGNFKASLENILRGLGMDKEVEIIRELSLRLLFPPKN
ncbi:MAG: hypothetical protein NTV88_00145 [Candidatus Micrarchaeota archaeon]|nr:hypothetical protein [Candidatus Micrarchaeota archaeon]